MSDGERSSGTRPAQHPFQFCLPTAALRLYLRALSLAAYRGRVPPVPTHEEVCGILAFNTSDERHENENNFL